MNPYNVYVNPMGQPMAPIGSPISVGPVGPLIQWDYLIILMDIKEWIQEWCQVWCQVWCQGIMPGMIMQPGLSSGGVGYSQGARL